ncbi:hypothetical protein BRC77_07245 [Halobacteriales archaeon QH_8_64_26]|nr:MAG: hypothetical protein BRC77_07245 [Halobacteriales archaeon QH_8_64_26]
MATVPPRSAASNEQVDSNAPDRAVVQRRIRERAAAIERRELDELYATLEANGEFSDAQCEEIETAGSGHRRRPAGYTDRNDRPGFDRGPSDPSGRARRVRSGPLATARVSIRTHPDEAPERGADPRPTERYARRDSAGNPERLRQQDWMARRHRSEHGHDGFRARADRRRGAVRRPNGRRD